MTPTSSEKISWINTEPTRPPYAKIIATLGPASDSEEMLGKLIEAGVSIFRLNFSHGSLDDMALRLERVRRAIDNSGKCVGILGDLQGPKMRVGVVPDIHEGGGIIVRPGDDIVFRKGQEEAAIIDGVPTFGASFDELYEDVLPGQRVLINDGLIRMLAVDQVKGESLRCRVTIGGRITSKKGINLPESDLNMPAITDKDWACAKWAAENHLDYIALSFVRTANEIRELKAKLEEWRSATERAEQHDEIDHSIPVVAKIEKPQAVDNLDEIIEATDAIMVARGDLGVEMDVAKVPVIQKYILSRCNTLGKPVIVATQMLETMIDSITPTRAEASDVANAVLDGCDAVMLSGETAVGAHPRVVVETMQRIITVTESRIDQILPNHTKPALKEYPFRSAALAKGVWYMAQELGAKAVAVWSEAGGMARYLSQNNFRIPIYAFTSSATASRRMALYGGVYPIYTQPPASGMLRDWTDMVEDLIRAEGITQDGDTVLLVAGKPLGALLAQSTVSILRMGDPSSGFRISTDQ